MHWLFADCGADWKLQHHLVAVVLVRRRQVCGCHPTWMLVQSAGMLKAQSIQIAVHAPPRQHGMLSSEHRPVDNIEGAR